MNRNLSSTQSIHLPGLNGLRAMAAISVLWGHIFTDTFGQWGQLHGGGISFISDGVTMFFVISGFLITYLLLTEMGKTRTIDIPKFYLRRILRIWPIYYGYIVFVILVLLLIGQQNDVINPRLWYYIFFAANIPFVTASGLWPIVHFWSIGVEEQFYLFWPWLTKYGKRRLLRIAVTVCCSWLIFKYGSLLLWGKCWAYRFFSVTRFDCMMIGAIGAILYYRRNQRFHQIFFNKFVTTVAWALLFTSQFYCEYIPAPFRIQYMAIISLVVIMSQLRDKPFLINLETSFFDFIGKISYGIYVIHPILIFIVSRWYSSIDIHLPEIWQRIIIYVVITSITIALAWLSYTFYEKPFLRLKKRFTIVQSANSMKE